MSRIKLGVLQKKVDCAGCDTDVTDFERSGLSLRPTETLFNQSLQFTIRIKYVFSIYSMACSFTNSHISVSNIDLSFIL